MLQVEELMIGDWVLTLDSTHKEKVFAQVDAIEDGKHSILVTKECSNWFVDIDWIEPIPLTPEISEKNGFNVKKYSDGDYYADIMFEDQGRRVEVEYRYGVDIDVCVIGRNNTPPFSRIETQARYVHELQHIMRLCGITRKIII